MKFNEIIRNTDENNINFANHNKLATNYVGKISAIYIIKNPNCHIQAVKILMVRLKGLEPSRRRTLDPKSSASTNSATSAVMIIVCISNTFAKLMKKVGTHKIWIK